MKEWTKLEIFNHVDLQDSFVMSWTLKDNRLEFILVASLWPGHAQYEKPKKNEYTCYKDAKLIFFDCDEVKGLMAMENTVSTEDPDGSIDFGNIDSLIEKPNGIFEVIGNFGTVIIVCKSMNFIIT